MLKKKTENQKISKKDIAFYVERAKTLTFSYEEQRERLSMLNDYITNDIASDWIWNDLKNGVLLMYSQGIIDKNAIDLYKEIDEKFNNISLGGATYDEDFWTLNGLKNHPLWEELRQRARELLNILEEIDI